MNLNPLYYIGKFLRKLMGVDAEVAAKQQTVIEAASNLIPEFTKVRDSAARDGVKTFKTGTKMVKEGVELQAEGQQAVNWAHELGSDIQLPPK